MALGLYDRAQQTGTANTTVSFTLAGNVTGFQSLSVIGNGNTTYYTATDVSGGWEVGIGTYSTTGPTLTRDTILSSSNSGSAVTFSGTVNIWIDYPAGKAVNLNVDGVLEVGQPIGYADTGLIATFASTEAGYNQVVVQNLSNDTNASANINISNNVSTDSTGFAELGINSSTFTGSGSFSIPSGAYLASAGTDLTIGTYNANDIHFVTNSNTTDAMTIFDNGGISLGELSNPGIGNIACNNINLKFQQILTTGGTTFLNNASPYYTQFTGTNTEILQLPDATTCLVGTTLIFDNDSTQNVTIKDGAGTTFELLVPGGFHTFVLESNSTIAGTWLRYSQVPSAVEWGTTSLSLGPTVITGGTWNGGTIDPAYGGTGPTSYGSANYALYSTSASTLVAGTLPVEAGGTGASTAFTTGSVIFAGTAGVYSQDNTNFNWNDTTNVLTTYDIRTLVGKVHIGLNAGLTNQGNLAVAVGNLAGEENETSYAVAVGSDAGRLTQGSAAVAVGSEAGEENQGVNAVAIGVQTAQYTQGSGAVAVGVLAGQGNQGTDAVAIGNSAGVSDQGINAIAIGERAGFLSQPANSIVLNATGSSLNAPATSSFVVKPVRATPSTSNLAAYDVATGEVSYSSTGYITTNGALAFSSTTGFGTSGQVLQSNGDAPPTWINQSSLVAGSANTASTATVANSLNPASGYQVQSFGVGTGPSGVSGEIRATNNITAYFSDDRLKTRHGKIENALDKLQTLDGFYYTPNQVAQDLGYKPTKDVGVSAQAVQAILPEVVAPAPIDDKYLTVRYEKLVPLLIEAIKELKAEVDELKKAK